MKITAVTEDQLIIIDGIAAQTAMHGGFHMTSGEWAIHFDTAKGTGEIEYLDNRQNKFIDKAYFDAHYSWLAIEHKRVLEAEKEAQAEAQAYEQQAAINDGVTGDGVNDV